MAQKKHDTGTLKRRLYLVGQKERLADLISAGNGTDKELSALRSDYRAVSDELSTYYDDIPLKESEE